MSVFRTIYKKITEHDKEMIHHESWKSIYFGVERSKVKVTSHENIVGVGFCTLVSAGVFYRVRQKL